ncbi:MAG: ATP-binding protein, partial [Ilumatobacteraceae bacterium]
MNPTLILAALAGTFVLTAPLHAQSPKLVKQWETAPSLKTPESVLFDPAARVLYVANIDGK